MPATSLRQASRRNCGDGGHDVTARGAAAAVTGWQHGRGLRVHGGQLLLPRHVGRRGADVVGAAHVGADAAGGG